MRNHTVELMKELRNAAELERKVAEKESVLLERHIEKLSNEICVMKFDSKPQEQIDEVMEIHDEACDSNDMAKKDAWRMESLVDFLDRLLQIYE